MDLKAEFKRHKLDLLVKIDAAIIEFENSTGCKVTTLKADTNVSYISTVKEVRSFKSIIKDSLFETNMDKY